MTATPLSHASAPMRALRIWFPVYGGIGTWMAHLVFVAAFTRYRCNTPGSTAWMHLATLGLAAVTVVALVLSVSLVRSNRGASDDDPSQAGQLRFLGVSGLLIGAINLALILVEGSYVLVLPRCG